MMIIMMIIIIIIMIIIIIIIFLFIYMRAQQLVMNYRASQNTNSSNETTPDKTDNKENVSLNAVYIYIRVS
jgi:uncharacterized membrane protein